MAKTFLKPLAVCLLLLLFTSCHVFDRWRGPCSFWPLPEPTGGGGTPIPQNFTSEKGRFRICLPRAYENDDKTDFDWFIINVGAFKVRYFDHAEVLDTPEVSESFLKKLRDLVVSKRPSGQVEVDAAITLSGHPGREIRITDDTGTQIDRIYLAGNRLYIVSVFVSKRLDCKLGAAVEVLNTFEITE
jgi:hypothetical protein